jgi:hypothetical protein
MNRTVVGARLGVAALAASGGEVDSGPSISGARLMRILLLQVHLLSRCDHFWSSSVEGRAAWS